MKFLTDVEFANLQAAEYRRGYSMAIDDTARELHAVRLDAARLARRLTRAEDTLRMSGFTDDGGQLWKPPVIQFL